MSIFDVVFPQITIGEGFLKQADALAYDILHLTEALEDFTVPLANSLSFVVIPSIRENFKVGGRPPWDELKSGTQKNRIALGYLPDVPKLMQTQTLYEAATSKGIWRIERTTAYVKADEFDSRVPYGHFHMTGTRKMVARPFMEIQPEDA